MTKQKVKEIKLSRLLKEQFIDLDLKAKNKREVIEQLVALIARSKKLKNKKAFAKAVVEREKIGSTGIGNGVAIPHAKSKEARTFLLACARIAGGIDFDALDGEKTFFFFLLASPEEGVGSHLKILAEISRLVKDKFIIERLKQAKDKKEILAIVLSSEKSPAY